jgi:signal transduction histidine kinase
MSRKIVELHNGKIWMESKGEGKGSSFTFVLPFIAI